MSEPSCRVLYVRTEGRSTQSRDERRRQEEDGVAPRRVLIEEAFGFDLIGESTISALPGLRGRVLRSLPMFIALAFEVSRRRHDYDVVVSWAEKYTVGIAAVLFWRRKRPHHVAIMDWVSKPVVRIPLRLVRGGVDRILTWSSVQGRAAIQSIGFRPDQIEHINHPVDDVYFTPRDTIPVHLFSAGETQRDFPTLIAAVRDLAVPTVIAASLIGSFTGFRTRLTDARAELGIDTGITVAELPPFALRDGYASAFAVIVPLVESDNNAGISVILEAMSMGRPVIATRTRGQVDVIRDGVNGVYVAPGDSEELAGAITRLLADPAWAAEMGMRAREDVLAHHRADDFASAIRAAVLQLGRPLPAEGAR